MSISSVGDYLVSAASSIATTLSAADDAPTTPQTTSLEILTGIGGSIPVNGTTAETINSYLNERIATAQTQEAVHIERIVVLDDAKNTYLDGITAIDRLLLNDLSAVNSTIEAVNDSYQARIDAGCKTDLFWRLIDIQPQQTTTATGGGGVSTSTSYEYTYECTRINPTGYPSVGQPPPPENSLFGLIPGSSVSTSSTIGVSTTTVDYVSGPNGAYEQVPLNSLFGFEEVNMYGLKMYDEPYTRDIGDTYVTSFIGTCGVGTNVVVAMTPINSGGISNIQVGQLLICDKPNVFSGDAYSITGIGTAVADLAGINSTSPASSLTEVIVPKLTLDADTLLPAFAPEDNGNYVTFTVLVNPDTLGDLSISRSQSPYVPQTIKCPMQTSDIGKGVRVEFDNSGAPSGSATWNQFLEGELDPDANIRGNSESEIKQQIEQNRVREPSIGGGKLFHKVGFDYAPVIYTNSDRTAYRLATEGEVVTLRSRMGVAPSSPFQSMFYIPGFSLSETSAGVERLPNCSSTVTEALNETISVSSDAVSGLSGDLIQTRLEITNMLRSDMMDLNLRIWNERTLLGDCRERQGTYSARSSLVTNNADLINGITTG